MNTLTLSSRILLWINELPVIRWLLTPTNYVEGENTRPRRRKQMLQVYTSVTSRPPVGSYSAEQASVRRAQEDPSAFADLYRQHVKQVYRYILSRVSNVADAQDLTSQTFLTALESLAHYRAQGAFGAWLMGIARHKVMDHYRQVLPHPEFDLEEADEVMDGRVRPDEAVNQRLQLERVAAKLDVIAPDRAEAIRLRIFGNLSVTEVAKVMDKQEPAVRMLIHRGLRDLQEQIGFSLEDVA
jgi:RNA polymerase sigma-70 factor (ECF subfamily)